MVRQRVLVVCSGNTCRSPMAAALLQRLLGGTAQIQSAGMETGGGTPPTNDAVSVMRELGVDISSHRSRDIADLDLTEFDFFLAMTPWIADQLRELGAEKTRIKNLNVSDPYGKGIQVYRSTVDEIESQLRSLLAATNGGLSLK